MTNPEKTISLHHCIADGREMLCLEAHVLASVVPRVVRSHLGTLATSPSMETPGPRHGGGLGGAERSEGGWQMGISVLLAGEGAPWPQGREGSWEEVWEENSICKHRKSPLVRKGRRWLIAVPVQFSQELSRNVSKQHSQPPPGGKPARFASWLHSLEAGGLKNLSNGLENH